MHIIKAVFFDAYRTLLHVPDPVGNLHDALLGAGGEVPKEAVAAALHEEMLHYRNHCHEARDEVTILELRDECARIFANGLRRQGLRLTVDEEAIGQMLVERFHFELYEDVAPTLAALRDCGLKLGVISNFDYRLPHILAELGVQRFFDFVLTSALETSKPDLQMFRKALQLTGVAPVEAMHVGDDYEHDIEPARACGLRAVHLVRGGTPGDEDSVVSLLELPALTANSNQRLG